MANNPVIKPAVGNHLRTPNLKVTGSMPTTGQARPVAVSSGRLVTHPSPPGQAHTVRMRPSNTTVPNRVPPTTGQAR